MFHDICDGPVGLETQAGLEDWNGMIKAFLSHGTATPTHLGAVLDAEPGFAMGYAAKGLFCLMLGRKEMNAAAQDALDQATRLAAQTDLSSREQHWVNALKIWMSGHPSGAIAEMEAILAANPRDTLSAKVGHAIRFILGDGQGMRRSVERVLGAHGEDHPLRGYMLGCHAFTLEETGEYAAAERAGLQGLRYATDDAWGLHAVAHVYDMTARPDLGISLIDDNRSAWSHCNNFRYHVWWHKALLHLDRGETDVVLSLYDTQIREDKTDDYRDIANATSLLMRLELEGVDVGNRWDELADFAESRIDDGCVVFADLHYMLALAATGRTSAQAAMQARFALDANTSNEMAERVANPGVSALIGLNAFSEGRYDTAYRHLAAARPGMQSIGGSHAQRDVFERMTVDAAIRAGNADGAQNVLEARRTRRNGTHDRFTATRSANIAQMRRIPAE